MDDDQPPRSLLGRLSGLFKKDEKLSPAGFENEISELLDQGAENGLITPGAGEMMQSLIDFSDCRARQIMTPRVDMVAVERTATLGDVLGVMMKQGYSRLPVYEGDLDHVTGFIVAKDLLPLWGTDLKQPLPADIIRPVILVPGNKGVGDLLSQLRHRKSHLAIVLDEYGGTAGLVTLEDIIEEIVGDIRDEYDREETAPFAETSPGVVLASGQAPVNDLGDYLGEELPEGDYDTLGGFLTSQLGRVPAAREEIKWGDLTFRVTEADERKVAQVEIRRLQPAALGEQ